MGKDIPNNFTKLFITSIKQGLDNNKSTSQIISSNLEATNLKEEAREGPTI